MTPSPPSQREPSFADKIAKLAAPPAAAVARDVDFRGIFEDFVEGLRRAYFGAVVRPSDDEQLLHIVLWPRFRPAWHSLLLTAHITPTSAVIHHESAVTTHSRDELARWLLAFTESDPCQATLQSLREQALLPIDARFEVDDGAEILVQVLPATQELIHESTADLELTLEVAEGEPTPQRHASGWFRSAGVERRCTVNEVAGRALTLLLFTAG